MHFGNRISSTENGTWAAKSLRFLNVIRAFWNEKTGVETQPSNYLKT